ncbi:MAG: TlpA disulfide reductase family protein [bacterium]|nr:TlpA disulfide reductase family protein [bacterium]
MNPIRQTNLHPLLITVMCLSLFLAAPPSMSAEKEGLLESRILKVGADAPLFTCSSLDGSEFALKQLIGQKPVVLFFWSFFCGPCREEMPVLQNLSDEFGRDEVAFIGVNLDGDKLGKAITKFMADSNLNFITVYDELNGLEYKIADPYGVAGTPTTYAIGMDGKVIFSTVGHLEPSELKEVIRQSMSGT